MFGRIKIEGMMHEGKVTAPFKHRAMEIFRGSTCIRHVTGKCSHLLSPDALPPE
jgi:hypothetical protein